MLHPQAESKPDPGSSLISGHPWPPAHPSWVLDVTWASYPWARHRLTASASCCLFHTPTLVPGQWKRWAWFPERSCSASD